MTTPPHSYIPEGSIEAAPYLGYCPPEVRQEAFGAVLEGIETGAYDRKIIAWLAQWDDTTCRTVASLLWRCRLAGRKEGRHHAGQLRPGGEAMTRYTAHFTPEAWQRDFAVEVDPEGPQEWDCTAYARQHRAYLARIALAHGEDEAGPEGVLDNDDVFKADPAAPQWVCEWRGPFTIRVRRREGQQP